MPAIFSGKEKCLAVLLMFFSLSACQVDFDPAISDGQPLPVAWCLLDLNDNMQTLRLSQTFHPSDPKETRENFTNGYPEQTAEIYVEENPGQTNARIFYFTPIQSEPSHVLYQSSFRPLPETTYTLYIFLKNPEYHCFSTIQTIGKPQVFDPLPLPGREISFSGYDDYYLHFSIAENAGYHECYFEFGDWKFSKTSYANGASGSEWVTLNSARFFQELPQDAIFESPVFHLISYGQETAVYNRLFDESVYSWGNQNYTPILNGVGLFSSMYHLQIPNLKLSELTRKLISQGYHVEADSLQNTGEVVFTFQLPASVLPEGKIHRMQLGIARSALDLNRKDYFAEANVSDYREEYRLHLPPGKYYYQASITCNCLADSCLWDGFPHGQFGVRIASDEFSIIENKSIPIKPVFK